MKCVCKQTFTCEQWKKLSNRKQPTESVRQKPRSGASRVGWPGRRCETLFGQHDLADAFSWPHARHDVESKIARSAENGPIHPNRNCELTAFEQTWYLRMIFWWCMNFRFVIMVLAENACWGRCHFGVCSLFADRRVSSAHATQAVVPRASADDRLNT